jgi:hypothetical protein
MCLIKSQPLRLPLSLPKTNGEQHVVEKSCLARAKLSATTHKHRSVGFDTTVLVGSQPELSKLSALLNYVGAGWEATLERAAAKGISGDVSYAASAYQQIDANLQIGAAFDIKTGDDKVARARSTMSLLAITHQTLTSRFCRPTRH